MNPAREAMVAYAEDATVLRIAAQEMLREGMPATARVYYFWADMLARARRAEDEDPEAVDRPWCLCETCQAWLFAARWERLT